MRRKLSATGTLSTVAGTGVAGNSGDGGLATLARFNWTIGIAVDAFENIYVSDCYYNVIRMITKSTGIITRIAGSESGHYGYSGDGGPATSALLNYPWDVAIDTSGNIYVSDFLNDVIRKITKSTGIISTVAGNGNYGYSGDGGLATSAQFRMPIAIAVDTSGNIYVADNLNYVIRKVTKSTGIISTVAGTVGTSGYSGDGGLATAATLGFPVAVAVDTSGNIYVSDNHKNAVRIITLSTGIITSMPGISTATGSIAFDSLGNTFMIDYIHSTILMRKKSTGNITTVAGTGVNGNSGDGGLATLSNLNEPYFLAIDKSDTVYFTDRGSYRVRSFSVRNTTTTSSATTTTSSAIPNHMSVVLYNPVWWISASLLLLMW